MDSRPFLSVIVPAYNEEDRIRSTLARFHHYLSLLPFRYEIIVVNDGSQDKTAEVVEHMRSQVANLLLIDRKENKGKGFSVKEGMQKARGTVKLFADADNATDISHFDKMRPLLQKGYDVVIASRDARDAAGAKQTTPQPWHKKLLGKLGNFYIQNLVMRGIWDTQCGFKAFRQDAAKKIFADCLVTGWMFDLEVLALARKHGFDIGIIPANWVNHPKTHVKLSSYALALWEAWRISRRVQKRKTP